MKHKSACIAVLAAAMLATPAYAASEKPIHKKAPRHAHVEQQFSSMSAPRMIEIKPGYWISSWGCYTDDGNGRIHDCAIGEQR